MDREAWRRIVEHTKTHKQFYHQEKNKKEFSEG